ncbi:sigma-70 family RNA polymerase sigma factor [Paraliomyxa miuraensis]|uniref:sigma-70 family RNA polymerase sigma factor n=1 Tax=Paraliomyxa miuraensis TaxID=376150 RepID=UPI0022506817|nr:sigma-70 family RNA polymerase sigma factor [Paraliomyxa miuraensis]MCX4239724.1 sigma-70 family RNA polymerase sigma factor [Paraliomyxa miuraensis]
MPIATLRPASASAIARALYTAHSHALLAFFRAAHPIAKPEAIDLLQQTFTELLITLHRQPGLEIHHPRAFLFTIAHRLLRISRDRQRHRPVVDPERSPSELASRAQADDLEYQATLHADQRLLLRAMRRLTDRHCPARAEPYGISRTQILLYLRFWAGLTLIEVAEILESSPNSIASRQRRALRQLRRHVDELTATDPGAYHTSTSMLHAWRDSLDRLARISAR